MIKQIAELGEIEYIENLPLLRVLNFLRNPIQVRDLCGERGEDLLGILVQEVLWIRSIRNVNKLCLPSFSISEETIRRFRQSSSCAEPQMREEPGVPWRVCSSLPHPGWW